MDGKKKQFDPANPENKPVTDEMVDDGELLRDIRDGKTPTEQAFGIDLGTDEADQLQSEHGSILDEVGAVIEADEARTASAEPDVSPIEPDQTDLPPAATMPDLQAEHSDLMDELSFVVTATEPRLGPAQLETMRTAAEHGERFAELGGVIDEAEPVAPDTDLPPDVKARVQHPEKEQPHELAAAFAAFAGEDRAYRADLVDLLWQMAGDIRQARWELDSIRGFLERSRL